MSPGFPYHWISTMHGGGFDTEQYVRIFVVYKQRWLPLDSFIWKRISWKDFAETRTLLSLRYFALQKTVRSQNLKQLKGGEGIKGKKTAVTVEPPSIISRFHFVSGEFHTWRRELRTSHRESFGGEKQRWRFAYSVCKLLRAFKLVIILKSSRTRIPNQTNRINYIITKLVDPLDLLNNLVRYR